MANNAARLAVEVHGAVQGVGFRPFVYRLAHNLALTGWVLNDTRGVFIEVEGASAALDAFLSRLSAEKPPLAIITAIESHRLPANGYRTFKIRHSDAAGPKTALVLPDVATCDNCRRDIFDPENRRHGYPFTNCTNCGPRFSIIRALPYDRPNTTMRAFTLCPACQLEYDNPMDRRFHAQPNACHTCGPHIWLWDADAQDTMALDAAVGALRQGKIVAMKGLGGFQLLADAANANAVKRLRTRKGRPDKPLAVMVQHVADAELLCAVSPAAAKLLAGSAAPIVLLKQHPHAPIAANVAPENPYLGVMPAYTPLHHLLLKKFGGAVVATSGNRSNEPICTKNADAVTRLGHIADVFLVHNRPIERHVDDSVAWLVDDAPQLLRRARGFAPLPIPLPRATTPVLAVGAHLKNTITLTVAGQAFISQHIGNLESLEALTAFEKVIADFMQLYNTAPAAVAHDLHPDYLSTQWAKQFARTCDIPAVAVQHHHAHLAACLAENNIEGTALGVVWDGAGLGADGTIWGGEFLRGSAAGFERVAHLSPFPLPGGDTAAKEPRRSALGLLWAALGESALEQTNLPPIATFSAEEKRVLGQMLTRGTNSPLTSSAGRLFDGVAALLGLRQRVSFEGQAAMALEFLCGQTTADYPFEILPPPAPHSPAVVNWLPMLTGILNDLRLRTDTAIIAARFHNTLIALLVAVAERTGEARIVLSGGCFQNRRLTEHALARLRRAGFEVFIHHHVPPNDGGISLGQAAIAASHIG